MEKWKGAIRIRRREVQEVRVGAREKEPSHGNWRKTKDMAYATIKNKIV